MILVTGGTGSTGGQVLRRLSASGVSALALVRHVGKAAAIAALSNVEVVEGDMARPETLAAALRGVDRALLISSSDPGMLDVQSNFIDAARRAGVRQVVKLSGIMPSSTRPFASHACTARSRGGSRLPAWRSRTCAPGEFMSSYFRQVPNIVARGALFLPMEEAKVASIDVADIAEVAAKVLTTSGHEAKTYPLTGPEALTMAEAAMKLSVATGKTIRYVNVAPEDAKKAQLAAGMPPHLADALAELFAERRKGKESHVHPDCATILGRAATSFDTFARRHADTFCAGSPA